MFMDSKVSRAPEMCDCSGARRGLRPIGYRLTLLCVTLFCALLVPGCLLAGDGVSDWLHLALPGDAPVGVSDLSLGQSTAEVRGLSMVLKLQAQVVLRNVGAKSIRGLTLRVEAQDISPGGRGSVTVPSLNVAPGETFPVR